LPLALADFGLDRHRSKSERASRNFFCQVSIATTSGRPNFTKFAHNTWIYVAMNPFGKHF